MWHPLQLIPDGLTRWIVLIVLLISGTIVMLKVVEPFKNKEHRALDIEFARNKERAQKVIDELGADAIKRHLRWDNFYIVLYSMCLALACVMCASSVGGIFPSSLYLFLAWCALAAGGLDYIENYSISLMPGGMKDNTLPQIAFRAASIKFLLVGVCTLFVLIKPLTWCLLKSGLLKSVG